MTAGPASEDAQGERAADVAVERTDDFRSAIDRLNAMLTPEVVTLMAALPDGRQLLERHRNESRAMRASLLASVRSIDTTLKRLDKALKPRRWSMRA